MDSPLPRKQPPASRPADCCSRREAAAPSASAETCSAVRHEHLGHDAHSLQRAASRAIAGSAASPAAAVALVATSGSLRSPAKTPASPRSRYSARGVARRSRSFHSAMTPPAPTAPASRSRIRKWRRRRCARAATPGAFALASKRPSGARLPGPHSKFPELSGENRDRLGASFVGERQPGRLLATAFEHTRANGLVATTVSPRCISSSDVAGANRVAASRLTAHAGMTSASRRGRRPRSFGRRRSGDLIVHPTVASTAAGGGPGLHLTGRRP